MHWRRPEGRSDLWSGEGRNFRRWLMAGRSRGRRTAGSPFFWLAALVGLAAGYAYHQDPRGVVAVIQHGRQSIIEMTQLLNSWLVR